MSEKKKKDFLYTVIILLALFSSSTIAVSAQLFPTFALATSPSSLNLVAGSQATVVVTVASLNGFSDSVQLFFSNLPVGVTVNFGSNPVTPPAGGTVTTTASFTVDSSVSGNTYYLTLVGSSGSTVHTYAFNLQVTSRTAAQDFAVSVSPPVVSIVPGGHGSATVTVFSLNNFSSPVSLISSGGPSGVSLSLSQNQVIPPSGVSNPYAQFAKSTLSISVQSWVAAGLYAIALTGTTGPLGVSQSVIVHSTQFTLQVLSPRDFAITIAPSSLSIQPGASTTATLTVTSFGGFSSPVGITANGVPAGVSLNFSPNPMTELSGGAATSTVSVSVSSSAKSGTYPMLITGNSEGLTHSTTFTVTVSQAATPDFSIASSPSIGINQGATSGMNVYVSSINHFTSPVALSASWVGIIPQGVSFTIPGSATPPDDGSTPVGITFSASTTAQVGSYTLSVVGSSGSLSHVMNILVQIMISGGDFGVSISPTTITVIQGSQTTSTVTLQASGTFSSPVTLTTTTVNGLSLSFNPNPITMPLAGTAVSQLIASVAGSTPTGTYTIPIIATSGSLSHSTIFTVTVIRAGMQDFAIAASPATIIMNQGSSETATIFVYSQNAFSSSVSLSASWITIAPDGVTISLIGPVTPLPNAVASSTLTMIASPTSTTGSYLLQVTALSGLLIHTANVTVEVTSATTTITSISGTSTSGTSTSGTSTSGTSTGAVGVGPKCLIATSTFGSEAAPEVQLLRNFRDNSLMKTKSGSKFMLLFNSWYYSFSPYVAAYLNTHWVERTVMKGVLYPLVGILYLTSNVFSAASSYPEFAALVSGLLASSLIGAFYLGLPLGVLRARIRRLRVWKGQGIVERALAVMLLGGLGTLMFGELFSSQPALVISTATIVLSSLLISSAIVSKKLSNRL